MLSDVPSADELSLECSLPTYELSYELLPACDELPELDELSLSDELPSLSESLAINPKRRSKKSIIRNSLSENALAEIRHISQSLIQKFCETISFCGERIDIMSINKSTVRRYLAAFNNTDRVGVLACLTDDVEWIVPGAFHVRGKAAFDAQIENDAFEGQPSIVEARMTEENDVVICEGHVSPRVRNGPKLRIVFCDVFDLSDGRIRKLTSYLMNLGDDPMKWGST